MLLEELRTRRDDGGAHNLSPKAGGGQGERGERGDGGALLKLRYAGSLVADVHRISVPEPHTSYSLPSSLELSDTKVYAP